MKLNRLYIKRFKNLQNLDVNFSINSGVSILIGNNGSGKSNILEAISAIFLGLYNLSSDTRQPTFEYVIEYILNGNNIIIRRTLSEDNVFSYVFSVDGLEKEDFSSNSDELLPSTIVALYSGEELRLWENYYKKSYSDFLSEVRSPFQGLPSPKLVYLNKDYWNISLLTLLSSELENNVNFCKDLLNITSLNDIKIKIRFNLLNLKSFQDNSIVIFVKSLNPESSETADVTIQNFKDNPLVSDERELFLKLVAANMAIDPKHKLIEHIEITFSNELTTETLSEGEKKQLLLRIALEFLASTNSLVLFDEPDSHIHVANKTKIKQMLDEYQNRETILTTHSPTLMKEFKNQLVYLEKGAVQPGTKQEILSAIAGDSMSFTEQQIILNSDNDIVLVEGKTDIDYIKQALSKLKDEYPSLNLGFVPFGGSDNLQHFIGQFNPREGQTIIAFLDRDSAGGKALKQVFNIELDINTFSHERISNMYVAVYPKKNGYEYNNFLIEDYFDKRKVKEIAQRLIDNHSDSFNSYPNLAKQIKAKLPHECESFPKEEFLGFKKLFDLILAIKVENSEHLTGV